MQNGNKLTNIFFKITIWTDLDSGLRKYLNLVKFKVKIPLFGAVHRNKGYSLLIQNKQHLFPEEGFGN